MKEKKTLTEIFVVKIYIIQSGTRRGHIRRYVLHIE